MSNPCSRGTLDRELPLQRGQERLRHLLVDAHGAVALHVGVAAHRADARAGLADHPAQQQHVDDLADGRHGLAVLGQPHRPADDGPLRLREHPGDSLDLLPRQAGGFVDLVPVDVGQVLAVAPRTRRCTAATNCLVDDVGVDQQRVRSPVNSARSPPSRTWTNSSASGVPLPSTPRTFCGFLKRISPASGSGLIAMIFAPLRFAVSSAREHPRVVRARVLADDDEQVRLGDVVQAHRALADADGLGQRCAGRLVAHVRAVRQVVRAEAADEQLVEERGLVRGAARGVEDRLVRAVQGVQLRRRSARTRRPRRSARSASDPGRSTIGSTSRPCCPSQ